jgi:hypothetical protein
MTTTDHVLSAGFLFYSRPPQSEDIYFLLGMDDYNNKWSDFGGRRNANESEVDCAVREMVEETLNVVQIWEDDDKMDLQRLKKMVTDKEYTYRIGLDITPRKDRQTFSRIGFDINSLSVYYVCPFTHLETSVRGSNITRRLRVCYVKYISWQPHLPETFSQLYQTLNHFTELDTLEEKIHYFQSLSDDLQTHPALNVEKNTDGTITQIGVLKEWMEKQQIAWWSVPRLKYALRNGGKYKKHVLRYGFLSTLGIAMERLSTQDAHAKTRFLCDMKGDQHIRFMTQALGDAHNPSSSLKSIESIEF